jgi:hypothetical protein
MLSNFCGAQNVQRYIRSAYLVIRGHSAMTLHLPFDRQRIRAGHLVPGTRSHSISDCLESYFKSPGVCQLSPTLPEWALQYSTG